MERIYKEKEDMVRTGAFVILGALLFLFVFSLVIERKDVSIPTEVVLEREPISVDILAESAYVYDVRTKTVLFSKNADKRLPLASLTKVMSALVASDLLYDDPVVVTNEALRAEGDTGLLLGERWSLGDLLDFSLTNSSNDGMRAVALAFGSLDYFVEMMNARARELDLEKTYFKNETGLDLTLEDGEREAGALGSAKDVTMLFNYIISYKPEILYTTRLKNASFRSLDALPHEALNTNAFVDDIPGLIASKTGLTDTAGGNLAIVFDLEIGRPLIITVLGSTEEGRFEDVKKLAQAVMENIWTY